MEQQQQPNLAQMLWAGRLPVVETSVSFDEKSLAMLGVVLVAVMVIAVMAIRLTAK